MATGLNFPGPDFLCIGCQRSGTGWLYDQLASHPGFRMPPIKELHYFDRLFEWPPLIKLQRQAAEGARGKALKIKNPYRTADEADLAFLNASAALHGKPVDVAAYGALFPPSDRLCGDITPGYGTLPDSVVLAIAEGLPTARVIFLWRDPADRAWSHLGMAHRQGQLEGVDPSDPGAVAAWLDRPDVAARSHPTRIWARWSQALGPGRLQATAFDDIVDRPEWARARILRFLGADPDLKGAVAADHNRKADAARLTLTAPVRRALEDHFAEERRACAELLAPISGEG